MSVQGPIPLVIKKDMKSTERSPFFQLLNVKNRLFYELIQYSKLSSEDV